MGRRMLLDLFGHYCGATDEAAPEVSRRQDCGWHGEKQTKTAEQSARAVEQADDDRETEGLEVVVLGNVEAPFERLANTKIFVDQGVDHEAKQWRDEQVQDSRHCGSAEENGDAGQCAVGVIIGGEGKGDEAEGQRNHREPLNHGYKQLESDDSAKRYATEHLADGDLPAIDLLDGAQRRNGGNDEGREHRDDLNNGPTDAHSVSDGHLSARLRVGPGEALHEAIHTIRYLDGEHDQAEQNPGAKVRKEAVKAIANGIKNPSTCGRGVVVRVNRDTIGGNFAVCSCSRLLRRGRRRR